MGTPTAQASYYCLPKEGQLLPQIENEDVLYRDIKGQYFVVVIFWGVKGQYFVVIFLGGVIVVSSFLKQGFSV